jgi:hypothetical protein
VQVPVFRCDAGSRCNLFVGTTLSQQKVLGKDKHTGVAMIGLRKFRLRLRLLGFRILIMARRSVLQIAR